MTARNLERGAFIAVAILVLAGCAVQPPHTIAELTRAAQRCQAIPSLRGCQVDVSQMPPLPQPRSATEFVQIDAICRQIDYPGCPATTERLPATEKARVAEEELLYETERAQALEAQEAKQAADAQAASSAHQRGLEELWLANQILNPPRMYVRY
jgi:hypothetical protein